MTTQMPKPPDRAVVESRTWKTVTAGILMIIAGVVALVAETIYLISGTFGVFSGIPVIESSANPNGALIATGVIAIIGGMFALKRRIWWIVIVGVISSMFFTIWPILVIGIISIILIAASRKEFLHSKK
jgi:hypothetical protein